MKICSTCESSEKWKLKPFWDITSQLSELLSSKSPQTGFTLWHSRLKIHCCHCSGLDSCCGMNSNPCLGTLTWHGWMPPPPKKNTLKKRPQRTNVGKKVKKSETSHTVGGHVNWCNYNGKHYGSSSENWK